MKMMNKKINLLVGLLIVCLAGTISAASLTKKNQLSFLFVQHAKVLQMKPLGKQCYQLTLSGVRKELLYFSNRPNRIVGRVTTQQFLSIWQRNKIQPNTLVDGFVKPNDVKESSGRVLTFKNMSYQPATGVVEYTACLTDPTKQATLHKTLYDVTLFFDNFMPWLAT